MLDNEQVEAIEKAVVLANVEANRTGDVEYFHLGKVLSSILDDEIRNQRSANRDAFK